MNWWVDGFQDRIYENNLDTVHPDMVLTDTVLTIKAIHTIKHSRVFLLIFLNTSTIKRTYQLF